MALTRVITTFDRETGKKIKEEVAVCSEEEIQEQNINQSEMYNPLVQILFRGFMEDWEKEQTAS